MTPRPKKPTKTELKKLAADALTELERKSARRQALSDILQFAAGILAFIYGLFAPADRAEIFLEILATFPIWGTTLILLASGFVLFWVRARFRLLYGLVEYSIGFVTALNVFLPLGFDYSQVQPLAMLQVLGGAYIMVRGADNIGIGIQKTRFKEYWGRVFGAQA